MKWKNLRNNRCPKCNGDLAKGLSTEMRDDDPNRFSYLMLTHGCGFRIKEARMAEIVSDMVNCGLRPEEIVFDENAGE